MGQRTGPHKYSFVGTGVLAIAGWFLGFRAGVRFLHGEPVAGALFAAGSVVALVASVCAFRIEARRALGPPGSPERRRRRLPPAVVARRAAIGLAIGAGSAALVAVDGDRSVATAIFSGFGMAAAYGPLAVWSKWRRRDEDPAPEPTPPPVVDPATRAKERQDDLRRGKGVGVGAAALGVLTLATAIPDAATDLSIAGLALTTFGIWFAVWCHREAEAGTGSAHNPPRD
jgi:hypothetical protein